MSKTKKPLTSRQWRLHDYLKEQTEYKHLVDIMLETGLYGEVPETDLNNSAGVRALKKDIRALKNADIEEMHKNITTLPEKGVKIATKKEYKEYSDREWLALKKRIKLQVLQDKKAGLDNQMRLVLFGNEKPIIEVFKEVAV